MCGKEKRSENHAPEERNPPHEAAHEADREEENNMNSYKVYLTKSPEVVYTLARGFGCDMSSKANGVIGVKCGSADGKDIVPAIYHGKEYFYCAVEFENEGAPEYKLVIA